MLNSVLSLVGSSKPCPVINSRLYIQRPPTEDVGEEAYSLVGGSHRNQGFGSMPRCCNSLRIMRFIQAARDSSPSWCCASSIELRSSGSSRNWNGGFPRRSFLCVDTLSTPDVVWLCVITHYMHMNEKTTPRSARTQPGRLTSHVMETNAMAKPQCNQTHPKFQYRFLAINRAERQVKLCRLSIEATSEQEARKILAPISSSLLLLVCRSWRRAMFKIIVTTKNHRTGTTTVETCRRRYKTYRGAEKAAQGMRWVCRPDGVTATEEVSAEVVEVKNV